MPPATTAKTLTAIVDRSLPVIVPGCGLTLALIPGKDGRYRLGARVVDTMPGGVLPRDANGHHLPAGHILSRTEAECAVRTLMGLDQKSRRRCVGHVRLYADF
jgi:hypothetical protein